MTNRYTSLVVQGVESEKRRVNAGVPQGSPLSPVLFLFYNADLLDICHSPKARTTAVGFVDDVNILAYGPTTESNCRKLETIHQKCLQWANRFGQKFAPQKYELIHFTRRRNAFNLAASIQLGSVDLEPKKDVRVLGVWLDTKLRWTAHLRELRKKVAGQAQAITRITASTWGASFSKARQVYTAVVRPTIAFAAPIWHISKAKPAGIAAKMQKTQNKCLRAALGAFKATPIRRLETEAHVPPLDIHLDGLAARFHQRLEESGQAQEIRTACERIARKLQGKRGRRRRTAAPTPARTRSQWVKIWEREAREWVNIGKRTVVEALAPRRSAQAHWEKRWKARFKAGEEGQEPSKRRLLLHTKLYKAESAVLTQIRTGCIGLAQFLRRRRVPGIRAAECRCGQGQETPKHVVIHCSIEDSRREQLRTGGTLDYRWLTNTSEGCKRLCKWVIQSGRLNQFSLASQLIYSE
jgi:hypothetical protein